MSKLGLYVLSLIAIALVGLWQLSSLAYVGGLKPNWLLVILLTLSQINRSWFFRFLSVLLGTFFIKFREMFNFSDLIFPLTVLSGMALIDYLPWPSGITPFLVVILATFIINLENFQSQVFLLETVYNLLLTALFFWLISKIHATR